MQVRKIRLKCGVVICWFAPEHRNMPLESAITLISRNYEQWVVNSRNPGQAAESSQAEHRPPSSDSKQPSDNIVHMLRMVLDGRCLVVEELDEVIAYFQQQRNVMAKAQGVAPSKSLSSG